MSELDKVIEKILIKHSKHIVGTKKEYYKVGDIEITVSQTDNKLVLYAYNGTTDRSVNLAIKKYKKLIDGLTLVAKDLYFKNNTYYITLNNNIDTTCDTDNRIIGYCRVSTIKQLDGNSLEQQKTEILNRYPTALIHVEQFSAKTSNRPILNGVLSSLTNGDTLIVTKLDRLARNTVEGIKIVEELFSKGVAVHVLNVGLLENTSMGKFFLTTLLAVAEMERNTIIERTQSGKAIAKTKEGFKDGRPKTYTKKQLDNALSMLTINGGTCSYTEVTAITNISKSTLIRENNKRKLEVN